MNKNKLNLLKLRKNLIARLLPLILKDYQNAKVVNNKVNVVCEEYMTINIVDEYKEIRFDFTKLEDPDRFYFGFNNDVSSILIKDFKPRMIRKIYLDSKRHYFEHKSFIEWMKEFH